MIASDQLRGIEPSGGTPYASNSCACDPPTVAAFDTPTNTLSRAPEIR